MNEIQINYLLKTNEYTKGNFKGTFASDELKKIKLNSNYIINLDTRRTNGSHWILLSRNERGDIFYFCTSGTPPFELNLLKVLEPYPIIYFSPDNIQSLASSSCGLYCVLITYFISRQATLREGINIFTDDYFCNDVILREKIKELFCDELF
jgi:hypothetical protein